MITVDDEAKRNRWRQILLIDRCATNIVSDESDRHTINIRGLWKEHFGIRRKRHNSAVSTGFHEFSARKHKTRKSVSHLLKHSEHSTLIPGFWKRVLQIENVLCIFVQFKKRIEMDEHIELLLSW